MLLYIMWEMVNVITNNVHNTRCQKCS